MISEFQNLRKKIENLKSQSNTCQVEIYKLLIGIEIGERWKDKEFYGKDTKLFGQFSKMAFKDYLSFAHNIGGRKYQNTKKIFELKNGEELFTKWGRTNTITYLYSSKNERIQILEKAKKYNTTANFNKIKSKLFPKKKTVVRNIWKEKYLKLKKDYDELKKDYDELSFKFNKLTKIIKAA